MKIFAVRLNPDVRPGKPYSGYPTEKFYKAVQESAPMNGFHEAVNFLAKNGVVKGYLPPKHLLALRQKDVFVLITITAKTAKSGGDMIVGIQAGCRYQGDQPRLDVPRESCSLKLNWHYYCPESLSLLFEKPLSNARSWVLGEDGGWGQGPTFELTKQTFKKILAALKSELSTPEEMEKFERIKNYIKTTNKINDPILVEDSDFDLQVLQALALDEKPGKGNLFPKKIEVRTYQYQRDHKIVADALRKANGVCGDCGESAPFISSRTGLPYLEVHHIEMLKDGGSDTVDNVIALCPNCHKKRHFG